MMLTGRIENMRPVFFSGVPMQTITPFLWFNNNAEDAMNFYVSIFKDAQVLNVSPMMVSFRLNGQEFIGLNGGPEFKFTEAISLFVNCETQAEVDELWSKLTADGGEESQCGWLKDKFGLSWQIVPNILGELLGDSNREKADRVMQAMLQMKKLDIAALKRAHEDS
jgi:predicted 3-demethylubiquinone-9 3-methyltransferase (glyoxalase superfamily)